MFDKILQTKCRKITSKTFISINKPLKIVNIQAIQYKNVTLHVQKDIYQAQLRHVWIRYMIVLLVFMYLL